MIQVGTYLNVIDNSGAKNVCCIKICKGFKNRKASIGDIILVSVKDLRKRRRSVSKVKKGEILKALVVRTKENKKNIFSDRVQYLENAVVLLTLKDKYIGTRIFGFLPASLRYTKYMRALSLSAGSIA